MPLRPSDIEHKTFSTALRGYDLGEVDDFLDEVMGTIRDLEEKVTVLQANRPVETGSSHDPLDEATAVGRALIMAQETADRLTSEAREGADQVLAGALADADRIRTEARAEADRIRNEARLEADTLTAEREAVREEAARSIAALTNRVAQVRVEILALSNLAAERVGEMDAMLEEAREFFSVEVAPDMPAGSPDMEGVEEADAEVDSGAEALGDGYAPDAGSEYSDVSSDSGDSGDSDDFDDEYGSEDTEDEPDTEEPEDEEDDGDGEDEDGDEDAVPDDPAFERWNPGRPEG